MLKIRLQRFGRKHEPVFRVVLTDSKNSTKSGKFLETLGNYDARRGEKSVIDAERVNYWVGKGAQLSDTVHNLLITKRVIEGKKINTLPKKSPIIKEGVAPTEEKAPVSAKEEPVVSPETSVETPTETVEAPKEVIEEPKEEVPVVAPEETTA